jgi:hypothetical protein
MIYYLTRPPAGQDSDAFYRAQAAALREPGALDQRLREIDAARPLQRIFLMGCGRSGTWLLTAMFATLGSLEVVAAERGVEDFGIFGTDQKALLLKRNHSGYRTVERIPHSIEIAMIVRHPYGALTSKIESEQRKYHITPDRWLGEMLALQYLVDTRRPATLIIRYEDLVRDPEAARAAIAGQFRLPILHPISKINELFRGPPDALTGADASRPVHVDSIEKYRRDPEKIAYLKSIRPRLGRLLDWVAETYGYDIEL